MAKFGTYFTQKEAKLRVFLIDAENVNLHTFIKNTSFKKDDKFYIVGNSTLKYSLSCLDFLRQRKVKIYDFNEPSKDYADKVILSLIGKFLSKKKVKKCIIVSNDNIFENLNFVKEIYKKEVKILKMNDKENAKKKSYHIALFEKNQAQIAQLRQKSKDLGEFHRKLQKAYKIHGTLIYRHLKQNYAEEFLFINKESLELKNFIEKKEESSQNLVLDDKNLLLENKENVSENPQDSGADAFKKENLENTNETKSLNENKNLNKNSKNANFNHKKTTPKEPIKRTMSDKEIKAQIEEKISQNEEKNSKKGGLMALLFGYKKD